MNSSQSMSSQSQTIVITNSGEFKNIIATLRSSLTRLEDLFNAEQIGMKRIDESDTWKGNVQKKTYEKYEQLSKCYSPVVESLGNYLAFLQNTIDSYEKVEREINNYANDETNLDVN